MRAFPLGRWDLGELAGFLAGLVNAGFEASKPFGKRCFETFRVLHLGFCFHGFLPFFRWPEQGMKQPAQAMRGCTRAKDYRRAPCKGEGRNL